MDADGADRGRVRHHPRAGSGPAYAGVPGSLCAGHRRWTGGVFQVASKAVVPCHPERSEGSALRRLACRSLVALLLGMTIPAQAQISPNKKYFTLHTTHFYIHFTAETEAMARRIAVDAERAYTELASELHPPRGPIDVLISDDVDFSNGSAT